MQYQFNGQQDFEAFVLPNPDEYYEPWFPESMFVPRLFWWTWAFLMVFLPLSAMPCHTMPNPLLWKTTSLHRTQMMLRWILILDGRGGYFGKSARGWLRRFLAQILLRCSCRKKSFRPAQNFLNIGFPGKLAKRNACRLCPHVILTLALLLARLTGGHVGQVVSCLPCPCRDILGNFGPNHSGPKV